MENNSSIEQEILDTPAAERVAQKRAEIKAEKEANKNPFLKTVSRRKFLGGLAGLAALAVGGSILQPKTTSRPESEPSKTEGILNIDLANKILNADPGSETRKVLENSYTNEAIASGKLKDIDTAFWFVSNTEDRVRLLQKRGEYRESGKFGLIQLSEQEKAFCKANNFHEEWVAICIDSHDRTKGILQNKITEMGGMENFIKQFRPDLENLINEKKIDPKKISLDDIMLPVGALIGIAWSESKTTGKDRKVYALADIGKVPSINYIAGEGAKQKEKDLFNRLSVNGIKYDAEKVPGSDKTGDIGSIQFRPDTALAFIDFCEEKGIKEGDKNFSFNPFGLDAVTAACLMLSIGQRVPLDNGQENLRMAYINGEEEDKSKKESEEEKKKREAFFLHMKKSFQRWNGDLVNNILFWRKEYSKYVK